MKNRRLYVIGLVFFSSFLICNGMAGAEQRHLVPADKGLSKQAIQRLYERGEQEVHSGKGLETIGMPVSGVGTGQLYLRGDGTLGLWQIFNKHVFTGYGRDCYRTYQPDSPVDSGFAVVVHKDGKRFAKTLDRDFGTVEFSGEYPIGFVRYRDDEFPVKVRLTASSPFIPLNAKDSALPATMFSILVENTSDVSLPVSVVGWLENAVLIDSASVVHALRRTRIVEEKGRTLIVHTAEKSPLAEGAVEPRAKIVLADFEGPDYGQWMAAGKAFGERPAKGTLAMQQKVSGFSGNGLANTFLGGDGLHGTLTSPSFVISRKFINFLVGGGSHKGKTCINLIVDGQIVRTATGKNNEKLEWTFWDVQEFEGKRAKIQIVDAFSGGWGHINVDQIELSDERRAGPVGPIEELPDYGSMVLALSKGRASPEMTREFIEAIGQRQGKLHTEENVAYPATERRSTAIAADTVVLMPHEPRAFFFVLAWFFPNHENGHEYANRCALSFSFWPGSFPTTRTATNMPTASTMLTKLLITCSTIGAV